MTTPRTSSDLDDLRRRIRDLRAVKATLMPDRDDPHTLSELVAIEAELERAQRELSALIPNR